MLCVLCPADDGEAAYRDLARRTRDRELRRALLAESAGVGARAAEYLRLAANEELYLMGLEPHSAIAGDMAGIYDRVVVRGAGRALYDRIKASAKYARCPLCGQRDVKTLDHYLSKQLYPEFAVFPANLVPCCSDCNKTKGDYRATQHAEQLFHPYFDDWGAARILNAQVTVGEKVDVAFQILPAAGIGPESLARARTHFQILELGSLYAAGAAVELVESKATFRRNFRMGADALQAELRYTAASRERENRNSWRAALYWGLAESQQFFSGGFERIEE